jgi:hypothetical protein
MTAPTHNTESIERELAALGEAPPSDEELALLAGELDEHDDHDEIATVARLAELAEPLAFDELSPLETHRGWRNVEQRLAAAHVPGQANAQPHASEQSGSHGASPRQGRWLFAAIGLAAAAALVLIVVNPSNPEQPELDAKAVAELGEQARASLKALDNGTSDTQRAEQLAAKYQQRLEEQGG